MGNILNLAFRLFLFAFIAAAALGVTNEVTKGPIEQQKIAAQKEALSKVLPGCSEYTPLAFEGLSDDSSLGELFAGVNEAGEIEGYALTAAPQGYGGEIPITIGVSTGGYVTQTYVGALSETAGLGTKVAEAPFMEQFIAIPADPDTLNDYVDTIGGATISSGAFVNAVSEMLDYAKNTLAIVPNEGDKDAILAAAAAASGEPVEPVVTTAVYDVKGFQSMKVEIGVDDSGKIASVAVVEHNETAGFGADLIADASVFEALVGQDIATAQIDVKAGVTMTSNGINEALKLAAPAEIPVYEVQGFQPMKVAVELDEAGKIVSVAVTEHGETPGFGADLIADTSVFEALVGQDIATAQIDVKAGVTMTSNGVNDALKQAAAAAGIAAPVAGDPYTVKGFQKFTLYIEAEDGKIVSVAAPEHNETLGFGADLLTEEALSVLVGQDLATAQVDVKSGVTMTSNAINMAIAQSAAANGIVIVVAEAEAVEAVVEEVAAPAEIPVYEVQGFQKMKIAIEVDADGKIVSVEAIEHSETPGFGADILTADALSVLVGQDITTAKFDTKSGVTMTSKAINDALAQAAPETESAAAVYEVHGFQKMKIAIAVDADGKIVSVEATEHSETPGFGADILTTDALSVLVGQDITTAKFDTKSGVTMTSKAINDALAQAAPETESAAAVYEVQGFQKMKIAIAVGADGKIVSVEATEHSETPGFGADILTTDALSVLVGQDIATAKFDVKSGVTLTSNGINDALAQAAKEVQ